MDKTRKLRRYQKKDYTQVVDFPVEIVGRDGVVRRYTFEASVRLYQRRIVSAPSRYEDREVIDAEVQHCRRRIEQLRHSYYKRFGWSHQGSDGDSGDLEEIVGEYAGEVAAFLRRLYGEGQEAEGIELEWIGEEEDRQIFFVQQRDPERRYLLYLYRFESTGTCPSREGFFELLRNIQSVSGVGVERLLAFHHTADCGLVLTGTEGASLPIPLPADQDGPDEMDQYLLGRSWDDPFEEGMRYLASGQSEEALASFERTLGDNPLHRRAYIAAAVVSDNLGQLENAELIVQMGLHHFPEDAPLHYHLGLTRFRQGEFGGARESLDQALLLKPDMFPARFLLASLLLAEGHYAQARESFQAAASCARAEDAEALAFVEQLERYLTLRRIGWVTGASLLIGGVVLLFLSVVAGLVALSASALVLIAVFVGFRRGLKRLLAADGARGFRLSPPENPAANRPRQAQSSVN